MSAPETMADREGRDLRRGAAVLFSWTAPEWIDPWSTWPLIRGLLDRVAELERELLELRAQCLDDVDERRAAAAELRRLEAGT